MQTPSADDGKDLAKETVAEQLKATKFRLKMEIISMYLGIASSIMNKMKA